MNSTNIALRTKDRTASTVYVSTADGAHEAKYRCVDGQWEHETNVAGDLEGHLIAATGSEASAMQLLDAVL